MNAMEKKTYITPAQARTLDGLLRERVRSTPQQQAYTYFDRELARWESLTWQQMGERVGRWQAAMLPARLRAGDRVAILLRNGPDWVAAEQAALGLGLVVVPLYLEDRADNLHYILQDAGVRLLIVPDAGYWEKIHAASAKPLLDLQLVVLLEGDSAPRSPWEHTIVQTLREWLPAKPVAHTERDADPTSLATIVYTSGTTGKSKGVMLSHNNILSCAAGAGEVMDALAGMRMLSFLPISHMFERTAGYYLPMMFGMEVAYARSVQTLADDLRDMQPQVLIAVPRIFERFHEKIGDSLRKRGLLARKVFELAVHIGWQRFLHQQGRRRWNPLLLLHPLLTKRVATPLLTCFGGRLEMCVSGGAPLAPAIARIFLGLGVNLIQGYGLTECSPVISANRTSRNDPASVGLAIDNLDVRIGDNDELQVNGPGVMLGYWNNHKATHDTMTADGWLRTGDKARIDDYGMITITGRIKDILVMSNGEKIPPVDMEEAITLDPLFVQTLIIGEARSYLSALVVLNAEHWYPFAQAQGLDPQDPDSLQHPKIHKALLDRIAKALRGFPGYAKVRRITPLLEPWTVENGLLTPTLKTKRQVVVNHHADKVAAMYE
jgi:long-chain acyl-CoA synthetase